MSDRFALRCLSALSTGGVQGTVKQLLMKKIRSVYMTPAFQAEVVKPMLIEEIQDQMVGREQRVSSASSRVIADLA